MPFIRFILAVILTLLLVLALDRRLPLGDEFLPPLGAFLSPMHGFWRNAEPGRPEAFTMTSPMEGIGEDIAIHFDQNMVPRIYAGNLLDAVFAQGYTAAYLRLFQMEMSTRSPIGRLSEVIGPRTLEHDLRQRRRGILEAAERLAASWDRDPETGPFIKAFVDGINARIAELGHADLPIEFKLLDFRPEPWTTTRCAAFYLAMSEVLARTSNDIPLSNALHLYGKEQFDLLFPDRNPYDQAVIPGDATMPDSLFETAGHTAPTEVGSLWRWEQYIEPSEPGIGSNNWALAPSRTASGSTILCNDPHLNLTLPSIWLEMQITTPDHAAYGVAFTGIPGIAIGFNEHITWGFTNAGHDVLDWYSIQWAGQDRMDYYVDGKKLPVTVREEIIQVRGRKEPVRDTVRYTIWGPAPQIAQEGSGSDLAMHWLPALELDPAMPGLFTGINRSIDFHDWLRPLLQYDAPMQNAIFASRTGDIALRVSGLMPLRANPEGRLPLDGSSRTSAWAGSIPDVENPMAYNPASGFVASANQQSTDASYPHYYTGVFEDWRGRYLSERLTATQAATVEDMMALQTDNTSLWAREAVRVLLPLTDTTQIDAVERNALQAVATWDHRFEALQNVPVLFDLWMNGLDSLAWDEIYAARDSIPVQIPEDWRLIDLLRSKPDLAWWDVISTPDQEDAKALVTRAFREAVAHWKELSSKGKANWGDFQTTSVRHLARIDAFSVLNLPIGGHKTALNAIGPSSGPSWRMIVEMGGGDTRAFGIYPGGQSGNPGSPFYRNFLDTWVKGEYRSLQIVPEREQAAEKALLSVELKKRGSA